jgi:hypothetical protein
METFDQVVPGLAQLLGGPKPEQQEPGMADIVQPQGPGLLERGQSAVQANPMLSQIALHTMLALAQGHNLGGAIANGGRAALMMQAQQKLDQENQAKITREQGNKDREYGMQEKRLGLEEKRTGYEEQRLGNETKRLGFEAQRVANDTKNTESVVANRAVQTKKTEQEVDQNSQTFGLKKDQLRAEIARIQEQIASSKDQTKTRALQRQLDGVKLKYADADISSQIEARQVSSTGKALDNEAQGLKNDAFRSAPPEAQQAGATGVKGGKAPKSTSERFADFVRYNGDFYLDEKTGRPDMARMEADFYRQESVGGAQKPAAGNDVQAQFDAAFNAAKSGEVFRVNGKIYRKP